MQTTATTMKPIATIGLDIAKSVFQVHGVDIEGRVVVRQQLKRKRMIALFAKREPCLASVEACASANHSGREITALGHEVRLMPPAYVKPDVKRQKNDAADDRYLRSLFCAGALSVIRYAQKHDASPLADRVARAPADQGRRDRARQ